MNTMSDVDSSRASPPLSSLLLATAQVTEAVLGGQSMTEALAAVSTPSRAATQALAFHTMRQLGWARAVKNQLIARTPPSPLLDALALVAIALLKPSDAASKASIIDFHTAAMPSYAPHTVVDQAVTAAANDEEMARFKGLLNGSLRRFLRERNDVLRMIDRDLEAKWNHPMWWIALVRNTYPQQWEEVLAGAQRPAPLTLRVNRRLATPEQVIAAFAQAGVTAVPVGESGLMLTQPRPVTQLPGFAEGWWSVQDAGAQLAAPLLPLKDGMRVLDACAAPGGKTAHMLELADVEMLALDSDARRLTRVTENLDRLKLNSSKVTVKAASALDLDSWWDGKPFDAVLADVPCTASGIVRRHPDIRWLRRQDDVARTATLQSRMTDALWRTVAPGGHMLYVTCSIFPAEGARQAAAFSRRHADAERLNAPGQLLPIAAEATAETQRDGFFYALFAKQS